MGENNAKMGYIWLFVYYSEITKHKLLPLLHIVKGIMHFSKTTYISHKCIELFLKVLYTQRLNKSFYNDDWELRQEIDSVHLDPLYQCTGSFLSFHTFGYILSPQKVLFTTSFFLHLTISFYLLWIFK